MAADNRSGSLSGLTEQEAKEIIEPSGDHDGSMSSLLVRAWSLEPSGFMSQSPLPLLVKTTHSPFGESSGA